MNNENNCNSAMGFKKPIVNELPDFNELMELNKLWKQEYDILKQHLDKEKKLLQQDKQKLKEEVERCELRCSALEMRNASLQAELLRLAHAFQSMNQCSTRSELSTNKDEVQLIKEQLHLFKEDFKLEHKDKKKIQSEKETLQERLFFYEKQIHDLEKELDLYKQECESLRKEQGRPKRIDRHPSVDRSNSYPSTTSCTQSKYTKSKSLPRMSKSTHCMGEDRQGYVNLSDFRHEQYRRGILVRSPQATSTEQHGRSNTSYHYTSPPSTPGITNHQHSDSNLEQTNHFW